MDAEIGCEAQIPNPALKPLEALVGQWRTTGTHPLVPGKTFHGRTSFSWQEGGAFLLMRSEIDEPEIPSGIAFIGSDNALNSLLMLYFDERGVSRKLDITVDGNVITWRHDDPKFMQTNTLTIEDGGRRIVGKGRMSRNGGAWEDDLALTYERVET